MEIVDSQVHVWGPNTPARPWRTTAGVQRDTPVSAAEVLGWMDAAGISAAVLVPPSWEGDRNDLACDAARGHPARFGVMGRVDPASVRLREDLARWRTQPGMLGVRLALHTPPLRQPFLDGHYDWMWEELQRHDLPVMVLIHHPYMPMIDAIAARYPRLRLVMDHLGLAIGEKDALAFRGLDQLLALAKRDNVAVKASALPCYTEERYPYPGLQRHLERVHRAFGARRVFWGTDQTRSPIGYREGVELFTRHMPFLGEEDLEWVMGRGVREWLRWER